MPFFVHLRTAQCEIGKSVFRLAAAMAMGPPAAVMIASMLMGQLYWKQFPTCKKIFIGIP